MAPMRTLRLLHPFPSSWLTTDGSSRLLRPVSRSKGDQCLEERIRDLAHQIIWGDRMPLTPKKWANSQQGASSTAALGSSPSPVDDGEPFRGARS